VKGSVRTVSDTLVNIWDVRKVGEVMVLDVEGKDGSSRRREYILDDLCGLKEFSSYVSVPWVKGSVPSLARALYEIHLRTLAFSLLQRVKRVDSSLLMSRIWQILCRTCKLRFLLRYQRRLLICLFTKSRYECQNVYASYP
jgi:hypothetical protein